MRDSAWVATKEAERKAARTNDTIPVPAPPRQHMVWTIEADPSITYCLIVGHD